MIVGGRLRAVAHVGSWLLALATFDALGAGACHRDIRLFPATGGTSGAAGSSGGAAGSVIDETGVAGRGGLVGAAGRGTAGRAGSAGGSAGAGGLGGIAGGSAGTGGDGGAAGSDDHVDGGGASDGSVASCPPVRMPTSSGPTCASTLETRGHRFALCMCNNLIAAARIRTEGYDSTTNAWDEVSAAIGTNGALQSTAEVRAGGAIYVSSTTPGPAGILAEAHVQAGTSLYVGGPLDQVSSNTDVGTNAYVAGDVSGDVRIRGELYASPTSSIGAAVQSVAVERELVNIAAPCDCSLNFANPISAVAMANAQNVDALRGINPNALMSVSAPTTFDVDCGTFYLSAIDTNAPLTIAVHANALLAVGGDVAIRNGLNVVLDPGASLDLVIGGHLNVSGGGMLGTMSAPTRFRVWVAAVGTVVLDDQPTIGAMIHAGGSGISARSGFALYGRLVAQSINPGGEVDIYYDRAALSVGAECGEPTASLP
jgi:hypothetical protein